MRFANGLIGTRPASYGRFVGSYFWSTAMSSSFRDSSVVILDTSRTLIRAGIGLHELLRTPSVVGTAIFGDRTCYSP